MTLANLNRPNLFEEYVGQEGAVSYLKSVIKTDNHSNGLLITGSPGIGKTSLAYLYVKSTLCEVREEGSFESCGKCASCLAHIEKSEHPNITYYRITEASVFKEAVNDLISMTKASPVPTHDNIRSDNHKRFIIIDEVQSASKQSISPFLDSLEFAVKDVVVILISMDLNKMDTIVRDAIESRCIELSLNNLTSIQISEKLQEATNELHPEAADLIAYLSNGNVRKAWSLLEYFTAQFQPVELTAEIVSNHKLNGLNQVKCKELIDSLETSTWQNTSQLIETLFNGSTQSVDYFLTYLINQELNHEGVKLVSTLSVWLQSSYKVPVATAFRLFQGTNLSSMNEAPIIKKIQEAPVVIEVMEEAKPTKPLLTITQQLETILGKKVHADIAETPAYLSYTKWSQFINSYGNSN